MTRLRFGTFVAAVEPRVTRFRYLEATARTSGYSVGSEEVNRWFSDPRQAALESAALAKPLATISEQVSFQESNARAADPDASVETMTAALTLDETSSNDLLSELAAQGALLRAQLTPEFVTACRSHGFLTRTANEPELTVQEATERAHVLWDFIYDDRPSDDLRWEAFWGFRVPVTHWLPKSRPDELRLRHSMFAGIHEELPFAAREVAGVAERMQCGPDYPSLSTEFRASVRDELVKANRTEQEADDWIAKRGSGWLQDFLVECSPKPSSSKWKQKQLVEILRATQSAIDLVHFACHSTSTGEINSTNHMTMNVGGEDITIQVSTMITDLRDEEGKGSNGPPFVFLNACRDLSVQREFQPAPFATAWIDCGAQAVISAVCPVPDFFAHAFALKYYDFLFGREQASYAGEPVAGSLAASLLATRRYFMEKHQNPLGLAYVLYAPPRARLIGMRSGG